MLISSPAQAVTQWLLVIVIIVPRVRLSIRINFVRGLISRGGS